VASSCEEGGEPIREISGPVDIRMVGISCSEYSHYWTMLADIRMCTAPTVMN
jgi:hypothetical protein